jgi:hypothetical protein
LPSRCRGFFCTTRADFQILPKLRAFIDHMKSRSNVGNKTGIYVDDKRTRARKKG